MLPFMALFLGVVALSEAACLVGSGTCSSTPAQDTVLLQTDHAASVRRSDVPALMPEWATGSGELAPEAILLNSTSPGASLFQEAEEAWLGSAPTAKEQEHFRLVKAERARGWTCPDGTYFPPNNGEFKWDCRLSRAARAWSQRMANENFVAHKKAGSNSCQRTEAQGFPKNRGCGENIAAGDGSPQGAIEQLKKSNNHCTNMFEPKYNKLGVGFANNRNSEYQDYWTDSFGDWHYGPDESCIGGSPAPKPAAGCADIDTMNCQIYKDQGYCTVSDNVKRDCRDTCGIGNCGNRAAPRRAAPASGCRDNDGACAHYKSQGYCTMAGSSGDHIRKECQKTCGSCQAAPASGCRDKDGACAHYKSKGYCTMAGSSGDHIRGECQKTCGQC